MTSEEIKQTHPSDISTNSWLREVCILLALLVEQATTEPKIPAKLMKKAG